MAPKVTRMSHSPGMTQTVMTYHIECLFVDEILSELSRLSGYGDESTMVLSISLSIWVSDKHLLETESSNE